MMQMVKIQIPDDDECAKAFGALVRRFRVDCFRENIFIVPEAALETLREMHTSFHELGRGGIDYAQKALRDSAAVET